MRTRTFLLVLSVCLVASPLAGCGPMTLDTVKSDVKIAATLAGSYVVPKELSVATATKVVAALTAARPAIQALSINGDLVTPVANIIQGQLTKYVTPDQLAGIMLFVKGGLVIGQGYLNKYPSVVSKAGDAASVLDAAVSGLIIGLQTGINGATPTTKVAWAWVERRVSL